MSTSSTRQAVIRICAVSVCLASTTVAAQEPSTTIETLNVTGDRLTLPEAQQAIAQIPGGATLVDMNKVSERNVSSLADALRYVPGVFSDSTSGTDGIFFSSRGSNLDATDYDMNGIKLLQDGLPITTADGNNHNRLIDPLSARYATVARGANALTYGASTLGGAIAFVSPTARDSDPVEVLVNGGSFGQRQGRATVSGEFSDTLDGLVTVEGKEWDGYRDHNKQTRYGAYGNAGWQVTDSVTTRLYGSYIQNEQELAGSLSEAQVHQDPDQASPAAIGGNFQLNVDSWRLANTTTWQIDANRSFFVGVSIEEQKLYHPIVDKIMVDFDGPGPAAAGRSLQPADRHQSPRRRRRDALRAAHRRARAGVRPELRRRLGGRQPLPQRRRQSQRRHRGDRQLRQQPGGLCDGSLAVRRPVDADRRRAVRGRRSSGEDARHRQRHRQQSERRLSRPSIRASV